MVMIVKSSLRISNTPYGVNMIYILGISHDYQWKKEESAYSNFIRYVRETVTKLNIEIIAEEWASSFFKEASYNNLISTSPQDIADEFHIKHIYADTDRNVGEKLGIRRDVDIKAQLGIKGCEMCMKEEDRNLYDKLRMPNHRKREEYWLSQIDGNLDKHILFVLGYQHASHFKQLLNCKGVASNILPTTFITKPLRCYLCD